MIVEEHLVDEAAGLALIGHRNDLPTFGVVAKSGRVRHSDELIVHHRFGDFEWCGHDPAQCLGICPVLDDEVFAIDEAIGAGRESRAGQWHGERARAHGFVFHHGRLRLVWGDRAGLAHGRRGPVSREAATPRRRAPDRPRPARPHVPVGADRSRQY